MSIPARSGDDPVGASFKKFLRKAEGYGGRYAVFARAVLDDSDLLAIASHARGPIADLMMAVVQFTVRAHDDRQYMVLFDEKLPGEATEGFLQHLFRECCFKYRAEISESLGARRLQTNDPGRNAALVVGLGEVARRRGRLEPVRLIDVGASAGFQLIFDRFEYSFSALGAEVCRISKPGVFSPESGARIATRVHGSWSGKLPETIPDIIGRVGVDQHPLDVASAEARLWCRSFIWPEETARARLVDSALGMARDADLRMVKADVLDALPKFLHRWGGGLTCIFHSHTRAQMTPADALRFDELLDVAVEKYGCVNIGLEGRWGELPTPAFESPNQTYAGLYVRASREPRDLIGIACSHGEWIEFR